MACFEKNERYGMLLEDLIFIINIEKFGFPRA